METLALHAVVHPALAGTEGEAGDVLVGTAGSELALRAAGRVCVWAVALTLQLGALQPAGLTSALFRFRQSARCLLLLVIAF